MPDRSPETHLPGQIVMSWEDAQRIASTAAQDAVARFKEHAPVTRDEFKKIAEEVADNAADKALDRLLERIGADGDDGIKELRKSLEWAATMRGVQQTVFRQGLISFVVMFFTGIGFAVAAAWKTKAGG